MRMKASIRAQKSRSKTTKVHRRQGRLYVCDIIGRNKVRVGFAKRKKPGVLPPYQEESVETQSTVSTGAAQEA